MPTAEVDVSVTAGGIDIAVIDGEVENTRLNVAGVANIKKGLAPELPERNDILTVEINGEPVFNGIIKSSADNGDGTVSVKAYDEFFIMKRATVPTETADDYLREMLRRLFERYNIRYRLEIPDGYGEIRTGVEFSSRTLDEVALWITRWLDLYWWVDVESGEVVVGEIPTDERQLEYVLDSGVDEGTPPYEKVVVYGESPKSQKGQSTQHLVAKNRLKATAGSGEPVFEYKSKAVTSAEMANRTARALLREFWAQSQVGSITCVGRPDIRVFDLARLPEHLGGAEYVVSSVKHRLSSEDGYRTKIDTIADPQGAPVND
jgi:hypothetical protein